MNEVKKNNRKMCLTSKTFNINNVAPVWSRNKWKEDARSNKKVWRKREEVNLKKNYNKTFENKNKKMELWANEVERHTHKKVFIYNSVFFSVVSPPVEKKKHNDRYTMLKLIIIYINLI